MRICSLQTKTSGAAVSPAVFRLFLRELWTNLFRSRKKKKKKKTFSTTNMNINDAPPSGGLGLNCFEIPDRLPTPDCGPACSDVSMHLPTNFKQQQSSASKDLCRKRPVQNSTLTARSLLSCKEDGDSGKGPDPGQTRVSHQTSSPRGCFNFFAQTLDSQIPTDEDIFQCLETQIVTFVKRELKGFQRVLNQDPKDNLVSQSEHEDQWTSRDALLKICLEFLRKMQQNELVERLLSQTCSPQCRHNLKIDLRQKFQRVFEGVAKAGHAVPLNQIFTELFITEGGASHVTNDHEFRQIERASRKADRAETTIKCEDIFKPSIHTERPIRIELTKGVAGIGKTVLTHKFILDWAEDKANQDVHFLFPFTFRELNVLKGKKFSLLELVHAFFPETRDTRICILQDFQVAFIFDGLDECRFPLDFRCTQTLIDPSEKASVDVLLINLIRGTLLPSARLWITSRPAAANMIPAECVDRVTEVRGFTDQQKEEYLSKRFRSQEQAKRIISHIKTSSSLYIMCHIPVFCWITATVLEDMLSSPEEEGLPSSLTEMYIHFLVVQTKLKHVKLDDGDQTDSHWSRNNRKMVQSLGKLAFEQLQRGNLIFYESDLTQCGIDMRAALDYSGVFTQIFKEERGLYQDKVFCFVHLSVQEFLAALHVHLSFTHSGVNLLDMAQTKSNGPKLLRHLSKATQFYKNAVNQALLTPNGYLDLFLRFLLGLSLKNNQKLLQGLLEQKRSSVKTTERTIKYIKDIIRQNPPERSINLFHCLNELKDSSLVEEIQQFLNSGSLTTHVLSPAQWSALNFILLSSDLDVFKLKQYSATEEALLRLLPVIKASNKAVLSSCNLSEKSCEALAELLSSPSCSMRELDLSHNDLQDSGVKILCSALRGPDCHLEILSLSGCLLTEEACSALVLALNSNPSHLRELDLSYNHLGDSGQQKMATGLEGGQWRLDTLRMENCGAERLTEGIKKFSFDLRLDPNTANGKLLVSDDKKRVMTAKENQLYPDHPSRFDCFSQLLCSEPLPLRCYWEVEWTGAVHIAVSDKGIPRKGNSSTCKFGMNYKSWCLSCSGGGYTVWHNNIVIDLLHHTSLVTSRAAVFLDVAAGTLSFYRVASGTLFHLHTFNIVITEPLYAGFGIGMEFGTQSSGSVSL